MSLQVWLPLNGDLRNQGLSKINVTNNGATINDNGKIGKCYSFGTAASDLTLPASSMTSFTTEASISFWIKILSWNTSYATFFQAGPASTAWTAYRFGILRNNANSNLCFTISSSSSASNANYTTSNLELNTWYHLSFCYKTGHCLIYINGTLYKDYTTTIVPDFTGITTVKIGRCTNGSSYQTNCLLNDFRIYDHCLSEKEVKEIAKGLVLHYQLNNNGMAGENLAKDTANKIVTGTASGTDVNYTTYLDYGLVDNWNKIRGKTITISCDIILTDAKNTSGVSSYRVGIEPALKFSDNSTGYYGIWIALSSTPQTSSQRYTRTITLPDKDLQSVLQNGMYIQHLTSGSATIKHVKVELGSVATPWTPAPSEMNIPNIIYDISGYQNNGNIIGQIENLNISPKYNICTLFNGIDNCIIVPYNRINPDGIFTMNLWFLKDKLGTKNYETLFGGPAGFEMDTRAGSSTTLSLYMASTRGGNVFSSFSLNTWYMITLVRDGINELYYVNGELKKTIEAKPMPNGVYRIGAWASDTGQNYYGDISDFRIYATALSADDILELYKTSKIVNGTIATARDLE